MKEQVSTRYRVPDEVHRELQNWSRWCWLGEGGIPIPEDLDADYIPLPPPNERHARIVQQAWDRMHMEARLVLRAEYPQRTGRGRQAEAAKLKMSLHLYEMQLQWGAGKVEEAFGAVFP